MDQWLDFFFFFLYYSGRFLIQHCGKYNKKLAWFTKTAGKEGFYFAPPQNNNADPSTYFSKAMISHYGQYLHFSNSPGLMHEQLRHTLHSPDRKSVV